MVGTYVDNKSSAVMLGVVAEEWFAAKKPGLTPSTVGGYRSLLDMTILPRWGRHEAVRHQPRRHPGVGYMADDKPGCSPAEDYGQSKKR
jgi:hypothetical protein